VRPRLVVRPGRTVGGMANDDTSMVAIPAAERQPPWALDIPVVGWPARQHLVGGGEDR